MPLPPLQPWMLPLQQADFSWVQIIGANVSHIDGSQESALTFRGRHRGIILK